jgi:hypothetical protein
MDGLKPSIPMGKLKQLLPNRQPRKLPFSFHVCYILPPSMREAIGAEDHKTAAEMVRAADTLLDARGGSHPLPRPAVVLIRLGDRGATKG